MYELRVQKKLCSKNGRVLREVCAESKGNVSHKEYLPWLTVRKFGYPELFASLLGVL
jgi:hypothetical protein